MRNLFIGPGDLAGDMGEIGAIGAPTAEMVARFRDWGHRFVAISSDIAMMTARAQELLGAMRR